MWRFNPKTDPSDRSVQDRLESAGRGLMAVTRTCVNLETPWRHRPLPSHDAGLASSV